LMRLLERCPRLTGELLAMRLSWSGS
jgi:hypothetical protein